MREVACSRNLLSGFVTTLKRLFESVMGTLFCLLLYLVSSSVSLSVLCIRMYVFGCGSSLGRSRDITFFVVTCTYSTIT